MSEIDKICKYQIWHLFILLVLISAIKLYTSTNIEFLSGSFWNISTRTWFWLAIAAPILHQTYVLVIWRLELYLRIFTSRFGVNRVFRSYAVVFSFLFVSRLIFIIILAFSNKATLELDPLISHGIALLITLVVMCLFYSVIKYFTISRAFGLDHFVENYNEPYIKQGIFKYTDNGMYIFGLTILYLPGILLFSKAAILVALFNHVYIWVHYFFTERPDMLEIYGDTP